MIYDVFSESEAESEEQIPTVSNAVLEELFSAASRVLEIQPWKQLGDTDWFAIEDPGTGNWHIVSILGNAGEVFAIHCYLPDEGIRFWNDFIESRGIPNQDILLYQNRMVCCEFVSEDDHSMLPHDEELNQRLDQALQLAPIVVEAARQVVDPLVVVPIMFQWMKILHTSTLMLKMPRTRSASKAKQTTVGNS